MRSEKKELNSKERNVGKTLFLIKMQSLSTFVRSSIRFFLFSKFKTDMPSKSITPPKLGKKRLTTTFQLFSTIFVVSC